MTKNQLFPEHPVRPRLIPSYKQTERRLLSVFMSLLEYVPDFRGKFLEQCKYRSGKTSSCKLAMEISYPQAGLPDVRPDGLVVCTRGRSKWSAFIEAKAEGSKIRSEQIQDYAKLAAAVGVDAIITISNEYASSPTELPYYVANNKRGKREIFHFSWPDIRSLVYNFVEEQPNIASGDYHIVMSCLEFFWDKQNGIYTYDAMPKSWPDFVESAKTSLGFNTKTQGITEIVHGWQQERRDLCTKLILETHREVFLRHDAGVRASADERVKYDRNLLAENYILAANYLFKDSPSRLKILADLKSCNLSVALQFSAPKGKKARATISWLQDLLENMNVKGKLSINWPGRGDDYIGWIDDFIDDPDQALMGHKDAPREIRIIKEIHDVRKFKSRGKFIEELESASIDLAKKAANFALI